MGEIQADHGFDLFLELGETRPARALEGALRAAIAAGRLPTGQRLPPTRALAADLGIARATVSDVYAQLTAEGWLEARVGAGTWVADTAAFAGKAATEGVPAGSLRARTVPASGDPAGTVPAGTVPTGRVSVGRVAVGGVPAAGVPARTGSGGRTPVAGAIAGPGLNAARARPAASRRLTPMYGGVPDPSFFPRREWLAAARQAVDSATLAELGYADARGTERLRRELAGYLTRTRGVQADPGHVLIGHGFASLLSLVGRALAARGGRRVAVEEYGHDRHRNVLRAAGLAVVPLPVDSDGADVAAWPLLGRPGAPGADAVLLTAAHQYPLGVPLSSLRRRAVVNWARSTGAVIIEDDYDGEFRFDRRAVGSLQGMAPDQVVYLGTASKALAPAIGLAWAVVPDALLDGLVRQRDLADRVNDTLNQLTLAEFFASHGYDRHVRRMRAEYRRRREFLTTELAARVPQARVLGVAAGLQATIALPPGTDPEAVIAQGLRRGLEFLSLAEYAADPAKPHPPAVVLGYGASPAAHARAHIAQAVAAVAAALPS